MIQSIQYLIDTQVSKLQKMRTSYEQTIESAQVNKKAESLSISREGLTYLESEKLIASITQLDGKPVVPLKVENNTLSLREDVFYSYSEGGVSYLWGVKNGKMYFPSKEIEKEYGVSLSDFSLDYLYKESNQWRFFANFIGGGFFTTSIETTLRNSAWKAWPVLA